MPFQFPFNRRKRSRRTKRFRLCLPSSPRKFSTKRRFCRELQSTQKCALPCAGRHWQRKKLKFPIPQFYLTFQFFRATPSPAVDSVGENGLFLRPGNHTSQEIIPRQVLLTLWNDIRTHRYAYVFDQPVSEEEVPGYHSAIKKSTAANQFSLKINNFIFRPMDLRTLRARIESGAVQTFGQFSHHIFLIFANACMYNSTGHHVNSYAKDMLAYALKCIQVDQKKY